MKFRKSSFSPWDCPQCCVEVAGLPHGGRAVRDSTDPDGPILTCGAGEWDSFVTGVRNGDWER